mgnify:CR=1 FL=1
MTIDITTPTSKTTPITVTLNIPDEPSDSVWSSGPLPINDFTSAGRAIVTTSNYSSVAVCIDGSELDAARALEAELMHALESVISHRLKLERRGGE